MKVSLVTTVKNEAATAAELIRSIRQQSRRPDEWLVVDGGSTDGTVGVFAAEPSCTVFSETGNIARGRNAGIARAQGSVIAVIDGGCVAAPDWLERLVAPLESGAADIAAGTTSPRIERPFDAAQWILLDQFGNARPGFREPAVSSRSVAFVRHAWERCRYPEWLDHSEDSWLFDQWRRLGLRLVHVPDASVEWRLRPTLAAWARQHFRYMHGQGRAALYGPRHLMRVLFSAAVLSLLVAGAAHPWLLIAGATAWGLYATATLVRFPGATAGRGFGFRIATLAWLPGMLLTMDAAKISGYLSGRLDRRTATPR
jgi:glycosyltransferase involved in cell wall biosynthesis